MRRGWREEARGGEGRLEEATGRGGRETSLSCYGGYGVVTENDKKRSFQAITAIMANIGRQWKETAESNRGWGGSPLAFMHPPVRARAEPGGAAALPCVGGPCA